MVESFDVPKLLQAAMAARKYAYAPYSDYAVGAALLAENGTVFAGCNVENASFGLTNCAERTALFAAVASGMRSFVGLAVVTRDGGAPCGACRQVLNEFAPDLLIVSAKDTGEVVKQWRLGDLLPDAFGPDNVC